MSEVETAQTSSHSARFRRSILLTHSPIRLCRGEHQPHPLASGKVVDGVRLRTPDGRPYKKTFRTKREAELFEAKECTDRHRGAWVDPNAGRFPFEDDAKRWLVVEDGLIARNPCLIGGAGTEHGPERPVASIPQVCALADAVPERYGPMVLLACLGGLRLGEVLVIRRLLR